ncbi:hypothetical protein LJR220_004342 [Bradyrhizobium sp. LjRoot220]|uniref:hypothetical protein n=1 Tax=Bradyrhizobium sp. LjRoot220 TaxID=3342284 RepID=UPI003ECECCFD
MSARTDALVSKAETGKMPTSIISVASGCHPASAFVNAAWSIWFSGTMIGE